MSEFDFIEEQGVSAALIKAAEEFRQEYGVSEEAKHRRIKPALPFYGKETLEMAMAAVLEQENLLLAGPKATGKNVLAENLAYIFGRPVYNVSFHVNTNSGDLIGTDTFVDNQVKLRKGSIYQCAEEGGFGILDEINMAKNDAVSVLHATLDYRRSIDVPGYDKIDLHPAARFIGTMNYGYAGTKELNEALVSRFLVIDMPAQNEETLGFIFNRMFPDAKKEAVEQFMGVFLDLQQKSMNSEISTKPLDLRGLLAARKMFMENKENESLKISAKLVDLEDAEEFLKKSAIGKEKIKIAAGDKKSEKVSMEVPVAEKSENFQAREDNCEELNLQDYQLELENRIRNLLWTISGDYTQQMKPDVSLFLRSKDIALYDGIKQGALAKFFDKDFLGMYLVKKIFMGADEAALTFVSQLCIEEAIGERICEQRPGIWEMQRKACEDILDQEYETMPSAADKLGYLRVNLLRRRIDRGENTSLKKKNPPDDSGNEEKSADSVKMRAY